MSDTTRPPGYPPTPPPPPRPTPPTPPNADDFMHLAEFLGFPDSGRYVPGELPAATAMPVGNEGRAGAADLGSGAVPSLPQPLGPPRFGDGPPHPGQPGPPPPPPPSPYPPPYAA